MMCQTKHGLGKRGVSRVAMIRDGKSMNWPSLQAQCQMLLGMAAAQFCLHPNYGNPSQHKSAAAECMQLENRKGYGPQGMGL